MKYQLPILALVALAECVPQLGMLSTAWPLKKERKTVAPKYRLTAKREILQYGPLNLYAKNKANKPGAALAMDPKGQAGFASMDNICKGCTILSGRFLLTLADGTPASPKNGVYIHHFVSYAGGKQTKNPISGCEGGFPGMPAPFIDRGEDSGDTDTIFTTVDGSYKSGYFLDQGSLKLQYDMVNYNDKDTPIYINLEIEYEDGHQGKDAGHTLKSVTCQGLVGPKVSEKGISTSSSTPMRITADAVIVWARGHLHAGGDKMVMKLDEKVVCTSLPKYNDKGVITTMSLCPDPIPVKKGQSMVITSTYDTTAHKLRESTDGTGHGATTKVGGSDVMGMMAISYAYA